jgi:hypothetical protein
VLHYITLLHPAATRGTRKGAGRRAARGSAGQAVGSGVMLRCNILTFASRLLPTGSIIPHGVVTLCPSSRKDY